MHKYICIHGHFYQPPRENPWTDRIEKQPSAEPYHDWNERITEECYKPNGQSKILDEDNQTKKIINNYSKISFNFGPTLLSWMEEHHKETYDLICQADKQSIKNFSGHGSAIAQAYHHIILPLANSRDKRTQIYWGIEDFKFRFKREPEGMWLPETAVDLESLDILAEYGVKFTILSPNQVKAIKPGLDEEWVDIDGKSLDVTIPYLCRLPSGKTINIFFYDGNIANQVAFGKILKSGEKFVLRLLDEIDNENDDPQLVHVATDGETYGHHHKFGEMALAYLIDHLDNHHLVSLTNYGEYLQKYPPSCEAKIDEHTSWSCSHGVERWRSDCGCKVERIKGSTQGWREHLREALDWLRDQLILVYEEKMSEFFDDPWDIRDQYIHLLLKTDNGNPKSFLSKCAKIKLDKNDVQYIVELLEMQRMAMMMYTSCGWFFDDVAGLETVQILQYAAKAIKINERVHDKSLESDFIKRLKLAKCNDPKYADGEEVYELLVKSKIPD